MISRPKLAVLLLTAAFLARQLFLALALPYGDPLDEPFHYGYASYLASTGSIPASSRPTMPADALRPMGLLPRSTSFGGPHPSWKEFITETENERAGRREKAFAFQPEERRAFVTINYEAQQPPLAYLLPAGALRVASSAPLGERLLLLRILGALAAAAAVPLVWLFFRRLLPKRASLAATAAFVAFPGVGSFVGRFSNDAVALPIAAALLILFAETARGRLSRPKAVTLWALLTAGLWTKLYLLPFLPAAPLAALLSPPRRRAVMRKRSLAAAACALALFLPWVVRQKYDTGDWLGLTSSKQATRLGLGLLDRWSALPGLATPRFAIVFGRTFLWPGTWSASGAPAALAILLSAVLLALFLLPIVAGSRRSSSRTRVWMSGAVALLLFLGAQLAYASTLAAIGKLRGHVPSAGPDGWYSLILFPIVLSAGCARGRAARGGLFLAAAAVFLAAEWWVTFGVLPAVYGGRTVFNGANAPFAAYGTCLLQPVEVLRVYGRVGLAGLTASTLALAAGLWLLLLVAAVLVAGRRVRPRLNRPRPPEARQPSAVSDPRARQSGFV